MRIVGVLALVAGVVVGAVGCGSSADGGGPVTASSASSASSGSSTTAEARPADPDDPGAVSREQDLLRSDLARVTQYGEAHPGSWAGTRYRNEPRVVVEVAFTDDVAHHRTELEALVDHPDRLVVTAAAHTEAELARIRGEVEALLAREPENPMQSLGQTWLQLELRLRATAEPLAAELHRRYGDALTITVGAFGYPWSDDDPSLCPPPPPTTSTSITTPAATPPPAGPAGALAVVLHLDQPAVRSGDEARGTVVVTNTGDTRVDLETGRPLIGSVHDADTMRRMGTYVGAVAGTGLRLALDPGASAEVDVVVGTTSCDRTAGYRLPPGAYLVRTELPLTTQGDPTPVAVLVPTPVRLELHD
jgi:hypothetical protein